MRLAIIGFGRLGRACKEAIRAHPELRLAGVVAPGARGHDVEIEAPFAEHVRDLQAVDVALVCVPAMAATGVARDLLQKRIPVVECAMLESGARERHYQALAEAARHHRVPAVLGAGWDPGMLPLLLRAFEILVPKGHTRSSASPGSGLHHTAMCTGIPGVKGALVTERTLVDGTAARYVYVELAPGATLDSVRAALASDPLFNAVKTQLFAVDDIAAWERAGCGIVVERRGTAEQGVHQSVLLEARFDAPIFAARVMVDAARRVPHLGAGAHRYSLWEDAEVPPAA